MSGTVETDPGDKRNRVQSPHSIDAKAAGASIVNVETLGKGGALILWASALICALAIALAFFAFYIASNAARESRLAQYEIGLMRSALREHGIRVEDPETHEEE